MGEYIEKAALMSLIESEARRWGDDYDSWQCLADIEDFKPADVRPVVRGEWEIIDGHRGRCSHCKFVVNPWVVTFYNFCPNCGADMKEETKE